MLLSPLPFDYAIHLDPHVDPSDRQRRLRHRPTGTRVRRGSGKSPE